MFVLQIVLLGADNSNSSSARLRFYFVVLIGNYLMNSSVFELLQFAVVYILGIEKRQIKAQFGAFFRIIDQYREEIKNNNNYVAGVVHDLRNPLTEIYSCSELLSQLIPEHTMTQDMQ
jgi:signal transduction histidine kinase